MIAKILKNFGYNNTKIDFLFLLIIFVLILISMVIFVVDLFLLYPLPLSIKPLDILFFFGSFSNISGYLGTIVGLIALRFTYKRIISTDAQLKLMELQLIKNEDNIKFTNYYKMFELFTKLIIEDTELFNLPKNLSFLSPASFALPIFQYYYGPSFSSYDGKLTQSAMDYMKSFLNTCNNIIGKKKFPDVVDLEDWKKLDSLCLPIYSPIIDYKFLNTFPDLFDSFYTLNPNRAKEIEYSFNVYWNISMILSIFNFAGHLEYSHFCGDLVIICYDYFIIASEIGY